MNTLDKEAILDKLLAAFDLRIDEEKGERETTKEGSRLFHYCNGRIDGVDSGRALVEKIFMELEL